MDGNCPSNTRKVSRKEDTKHPPLQVILQGFLWNMCTNVGLTFDCNYAQINFDTLICELNRNGVIAYEDVEVSDLEI